MRRKVPEKLSPDEATERLRELDGVYQEADHTDADAILLAVIRHQGFDEMVDEWKAASKRVGFWYV